MNQIIGNVKKNKKTMSTRLDDIVIDEFDDIYLIGDKISELPDRNLPTNLEMLRYFFYHVRGNPIKDCHSSAVCTVKKCEEIWHSIGFETTKQYNSVEKLKNMYKKWRALYQNRNSTAQSHIEKASLFTHNFNQPFEMGSIETKEKLKDMSEDDIKLKFLLHQEESTSRTQIEQLEDEDEYLYSEHETDFLDSISELDSDSSLDKICASKRRKTSFQSVKFNILTPEVCSSLDRNGISDRKAMMVLSELCKTMLNQLNATLDVDNPIDVMAINLSRSSINRARNKTREDIANKYKEITKKIGVKIVVQWDGKQYKECNEKIERLAVLVVGNGVNQLLGVAKLHKATGKLQSDVIEMLLETYNIQDHVVGMCFDTCSVNTGKEKGTCTLLEKALDKKLLHLACRHHIMELVLKAAFMETMGLDDVGPDVPLFKNFQNNMWNNIKDKDNYQSCLNDPLIPAQVKEEQNNLLQFSLEFLKSKQPRDDYRELLELVVIFLGGNPIRTSGKNKIAKKISIRCPGPMHHARWMSKALYSLKIYIFREQIEISKKDLNAVRKLNIFIAVCYVKVWFTANQPETAPRLDLEFLKNLKNNSLIDKNLREAAYKKFTANHLWYLSDTLVGLAFFDEVLSVETKKKMAKAIFKKSIQDQLVIRKIDKHDSTSINNLSIENFVNSNTKLFFNLLGISTDFLKIDPAYWSENDDYKNGAVIIKSLIVTNDNAERQISTTTEFGPMVKNEDAKQSLFINVIEHRRNITNCNKKTLLEEM